MLYNEYRFTMQPRGAFSLAEAAAFRVGGRRGVERTFLADETFAPVRLSLSQRDADGAVEAVARVPASESRPDAAALRVQIERLISLDHDATSYEDVGRRDPVIGALQARYPGLRPVCFPSPYEAAVWGVLAAGGGMRLAATLEARLAREHGTALAGSNAPPALPSPRALLAGRDLPKTDRLHAVARAALDGALDAARLRAMPAARALEELGRIHGVGPWIAAHVLLRGAGTADACASAEGRVRRAAALVYGTRSEPDDAAFARLSSAWRPWRTWIAVLLAVHLSRTGGWNAPIRIGATARGPRRSRSRSCSRPSSPRAAR